MINLKDLNPQQRKAVETVDGPILIFAGAGSGKTRVLTYKLAYLVEEIGIAPECILAVTFTNKAAGEMKARVQSLLSEVNADYLKVGTFHSICARLLRREIKHIGYSPNFSIYDSADSRQLIKNIINEYNIDIQQFTPSIVQNAISKSKNRMETPDDFLTSNSGSWYEKIAEVYRIYQEKLKESNSLDFDDLLLLPLQLFEKCPDRKTYYQDLFQYVLVDEYQDTNKPQFKFIHELAYQHRNICVVGDDDQSIYGWRGADVRNILGFEKAFGEATIIKLEQNYRSTKRILEAAFSVVSNNFKRAEKKLWTENNEGTPLTVIANIDERGEARSILKNIQKEKSILGLTLRDFVILYRTNAQSRVIEDELRRNGVPYIIVGGVKYYDRKEVKDVIAYLRVLINPDDDVSLERIINFPPRGLGKTTIDKFKAFGKRNRLSLYGTMKLWKTLEIGARQKQSLKLFTKMLAKFRKKVDSQPADEIVRDLIKSNGIREYYEKQNSVEANDRIENIDELLSSIVEYCEEDEHCLLQEFLEDVALLTDIDRWNESQEAVTLMTLHSAKGLEFPVVFIAGLEEGLFPLNSQNIEEKELEEERRLFYVGVTRGEQKVYLIYANSRRRFGGAPVNSRPSRFLKEIPDELIVRTGVKSSDLGQIVQNNRQFSRKQKSLNTSQSDKKYSVGQFVKHKIFGIGTIMSVEGMGDSCKLVVRFSGNVQKKLIARLANLTIVKLSAGN